MARCPSEGAPSGSWTGGPQAGDQAGQELGPKGLGPERQQYGQ